MKKRLVQIIPWLITIIAFYYAFRGINWQVLISHIGDASPAWVLLAVTLTIFSYVSRARRWQYLFLKPVINFFDSLKVLVLGFFMNNILPARAGEFVRAHMGSKVTNETRTLVLATIATERLADGLMLSLMFVAFAFGLGDKALSENLLYVALLFGGATLGLVLTLLLKDTIFKVATNIQHRLDNKTSAYTLDRFQIFINGLMPILKPERILVISLWSIFIWFIELAVYLAVVKAYGADLSLPHCVLFLVAVNFSSLIPAAPGGFGVIEAIASAVLVSVGIEKELALSMVFTQHIIQYLVVGFPGVVIMFSWQHRIKQYKEATNEVS